MASQYKVGHVPALKDNCIWLVVNTELKKCVVIDPGESEPVLNWLKKHNIIPIAIFLTHHHGDHSGGVKDILSAYSIPVYASKQSKVDTVTHFVSDDEEVILHEATMIFRGIAIPGHTLDHMGFFFQGNFFSGDTLFSGGCGRIFEGTYEQMYHSLQKIAALPDETKLYCGHEYTLANLVFASHVDKENQELKTYFNEVKKKRDKNEITLPSTIALEKKINPFLRCENKSFVERLSQLNQKTFANTIEAFIYLRELKNNFK